MGVNLNPRLQVEPAMIVVPQVVELLSMVKCGSEGGEGRGEVEVVGAKVAETALHDRRALANHDGPKGNRRSRIGNLADGVVALVDDEEIAAAIDRDADGVVDLGEIGEAAVSCLACGTGTEDCGDVASIAGG